MDKKAQKANQEKKASKENRVQTEKTEGEAKQAIVVLLVSKLQLFLMITSFE
jgi:hypothetical protein